MTELVIGQTIGQYQITEKIGKGGMADVYKAYQPALDRYVAIKVLPEYFLRDETFLARFQREAKAIARLSHPHILPVYDFGQQENLTYIVMKYVEAGTLQDMLGESIDLHLAAEVIGQVAAALDYAHEQGIIHRDVKPSNVLMERGQWALLTDFGLAKMVEASVQLTGSGVGVGTPAYMSPEQGQGKEVDARSDVYSLGVVLYEMATGRVPYTAETPMAVVIKHITEPLPLPRRVNPALPEEVERVILKALAKDRADRFASTGAMAQALRKAVAGLAVETEPTPAGVPPTEPELPAAEPAVAPAPPAEVEPVTVEEKPKRKAGLLLAAGAALGALVVLALLAGVGIALLRGRHADEARATPGTIAAGVTPVAAGTTTPLPAAGVTPTTGTAAPLPTADKVLYKVKESDETYSFYAVDLQGGPPQQLASGAGGVSGGFSPDGSQVLVGLTKEGAVNIYLMDADGGNRTLLLSDKYAYGSFLPDGQSIFVVAGPSYDDASLILFDRKGQQIATLVQNSELVVVMPAAEGPRLICWTRVEDTFGLLAAKADGSDRLELVSGLDVVRPFISDDGQRALYLAQRGDVIALHRVDLESGQDQELFRRNVASNQALSYGARLSEDWRWLLYDIRDRDSETNKDTYTFYLANVESGEQVKLTGPADSANGEFFPDSRRLWFVEQITPESEQSLYVAEANGSKPVRLAWGQEVRASFAPDGESLVVSVKQDDAYSLYVMSADGARQNKLVDPMLRVNHDCQGVFSPDRQRTLVRNVYGQYADELWTDLYLLNPDGSRKVLAEGAAWVVNGQFSADGQVLVFDSNRDGGPAVYRAAADGSDVRLIGPGGTLFSLFGADRSSRFYYPVPLPTRPAATPESSATETPTETPVPTETAIPTETAVACNPSLSVYFPSSEQVEISGSGWPPNELVSLAWGLGFFRTELGTVSADSSGSFSKTFNTKDVSGMLSKGVIMADSGSCDASADYDRP